VRNHKYNTTIILTDTREFQHGTLFFGFFLTVIYQTIFITVFSSPWQSSPTQPHLFLQVSQSGFGSLDQEFRGEYKTPQQLIGISAVFVHPATKYSVAL
jgi:hypothetical protein